MYELIFNQKFFFSFISSTIFVFVNLLFSYSICKNKIILKNNFFNEYKALIIFFLIFAFYSILINSLIIFDYLKLVYLILFLLILQIVYLIINSFNKFKISFQEKKILLSLLIILWFISILPVSDADSIAVFLYHPVNLFFNGLENFNVLKNLEFSSYSNTESILLISALLKSDNFGAQLNLISLIFFAFATLRKNKYFSFILLSSPLIIYFVSTQKLQLFFGILFLLLFIIFKEKKIKNNTELFVFIILLTFYSSGKFSYILFAAPLYLFFTYKNFSRIKEIIIFSFLSLIIVYLPLMIFKQIYFGNIISPFFDNFFGNNYEPYLAYEYSLRATEGWLSNPSNIYYYYRPFISFNIHEISSSLGLTFLIMLLNFKLIKKTNYFPIIIIFSILLTGQILPRYYFEAFLILAFYFIPQNIWIKRLIYSQVLVVFIFAISYIYISYIQLNVINHKENYMNKFTYSYYNSNQLKKLELEDNILDLSLDRQSLFFDKNVYSSRYLNIMDNYNNNKNNLVDYINRNSIKYLINIDKNNIPKCLKLDEITNTYRKTAKRNFLTNNEKYMYKVFKINNNC